jgi:regulatory protein
VREKLYSLGLRKNEVEEIVAEMIEINLLNEERFATRFVGGKFRLKHWGRRKIKYELKQKGINKFIITLALREIDEEQYSKTVYKLAETKWNQLKGENFFSRQSKTNAYLLQKGYEQNLISETLQNLRRD